MDALKTNRENHCFSTKEIETRIKFNPGLSANRPSNNWAQGTRLTLPRHLTVPCTFLSGRPECQWTRPRNNTYLLTLQANCMRNTTICQMRKHTTPMRLQLTSSDYFVFLRESLAKVFTNQSAPFTKARFQNKNKKARSIKGSNSVLQKTKALICKRKQNCKGFCRPM